MRKNHATWFLTAAFCTTLPSCGEEEIKKPGGEGTATLAGNIDYQQEKSFTVFHIALFEDNPFVNPMAPIYSANFETTTGFPAPYEMTELAPGIYYISVFGDVDPDDGNSMYTREDPVADIVGPISLRDGETTTLDLLMEDQVDDPNGPEPQDGKAALYGTVTYAGTKTGTLYITGHTSTPASGPPGFLVKEESPTFPYEYERVTILPDTYYVTAYMDVDLGDGMGNQPGDPIAPDPETELLLEDGDSTQMDFVLFD